MWALDAVLEDDFGICDSLKSFLEEAHTPEAWSLAANSLKAKLKDLPASKSEFTAQYQRNVISDWLIHALSRSGREREILPLCEAEAKSARNYERLVLLLMRDGKDAEALQWIRKGIKETETNAFGNARRLRDCQRDIHTKHGDWRALIVLEVEEFMRSPDATAFAKCRAAAKANNTWANLRQTLLDFLISGGMPWEHKAWPLDVSPPAASTYSKRGESGFPMLSVLIDIAIQEKNPEEVFRWYGMIPKNYGSPSFHDEAASAMHKLFPEQSIKIWTRLAENSVSLVSKNAYADAGKYLRKIQRAMHTCGLQNEWALYVASLRTEHFRKKRFLEVLDSMDAKPILRR
jgi:uncharacterized Zn finger protein